MSGRELVTRGVQFARVTSSTRRPLKQDIFGLGVVAETRLSDRYHHVLALSPFLATFERSVRYDDNWLSNELTMHSDVCNPES